MTPFEALEPFVLFQPLYTNGIIFYILLIYYANLENQLIVILLVSSLHAHIIFTVTH